VSGLTPAAAAGSPDLMRIAVGFRFVIGSGVPGNGSRVKAPDTRPGYFLGRFFPAARFLAAMAMAA